MHENTKKGKKQEKGEVEATFTSQEAPVCHQACCPSQQPPCSPTGSPAASILWALGIHAIPHSCLALGASCLKFGGSQPPVH